MKLNECQSFYGPPRAEKNGLNSSRFREKHMSDHAKEAMDSVKQKDRSDLKVNHCNDFSWISGGTANSTKQMPPGNSSTVLKISLVSMPIG